MHPRAEQLIRDLGLHPHPEGGHYAEVHRSASAQGSPTAGWQTCSISALVSSAVACWRITRSPRLARTADGVLVVAVRGLERARAVVMRARSRQDELQREPHR